MTTSPSWRVYFVAALYHTNCPQAVIARYLGISRQRVEQMLDRAGITERPPPSEAAILRAIRAAQATGLVRRTDIITAVRAELSVRRSRVQAVIARVFGPTLKYLPPPGTPADWRYCIHCKAFAPRSSYYSHCPVHYNKVQREAQAARRGKAGAISMEERVERSRARVASVAHLRNKDAAAALGISSSCMSKLRKRYERDGSAP